jgi:hypothetical protein
MLVHGDEALAIAEKNLETKTSDIGMAVCLEPSAVTLVAGAAVVDGKPIENLAKKFLDAAETRSLVEKVLKSAQKKCGAEAAQLNVFANLQSFALSAPKELIEAVSRAAEIASATANERPESLLIEPVDPPAGKRAAEPDSKSSSSGKKKDGGGKRKQSSE